MIAATLLDLRFKDAYLSRQEIAVGKVELTEFLRSVDVAKELNQPCLSAAQCDTDKKTASTPSLSLWDAHDSMPSYADQSNVDRSCELAYEQQLDSYLKKPRLPRTTDIYAYWYSSEFPSLEPAAQKYFSAPPTSVSSEQLFSSAGQLYADKRYRLLGENAEKLLFLAFNIPLFDFNY